MKNLQILSVTALSLLLVGCGETAKTNTQIPKVLSEMVTEMPIKAHGVVADLTENSLQTALNSGHKFVVFIGADWCPGCVRLAKQIRKKPEMIPENATILIGDYDADKEFNDAYGVNQKHTGVFFDAAGEVVEVMPAVLFRDMLQFLDDES